MPDEATTIAQQHERRRLTDYNGLAAYIGLPKGTIRAKVSRSDIPFLRLGPRLVRFDLDEIDRWLDSKRGGGR